MPPTKQPKLNPETAPALALVLFAKNLEEIRRWYRSSTSPGHEAGHIVMTEIVMSNVSTALEMALKGKAWERPLTPP